MFKNIIGIGVALICLINCTSCSKESRGTSTQFQLLRKADTGLDFINKLEQNTELNVFSYMYFFNGGGVAAGDFNRDGLVDLYFTSNMESNKLFLNEGSLHFKDVTEQAKVAGLNGWTSGASVVDINNDGLLDIYVSQIGDYEGIKGHNQLYVCQGIQDGIPTYEDQAAYYGLDFVGFSTQASFFDYDLDGDLDMYLLNHSLHQNGTFGPRRDFDEIHPTSGDKLFRNDSPSLALPSGRESSSPTDRVFTDVTQEAGIRSTVIGYGLGIATSDIDMDGWPDLYIGNDFHENDYLYINQRDGTFKEVLTEQIQHTSRFSMGVDIADVNNDGLKDIVTLDMLPEDPYILKTSLGEDGYNIFQFKLGYGYNPQFARNNLQLNNGNGSFSEIGIYAGIYASDWSWAPLLYDFDHDGYKDLFISNGIPRRMNDIDYINFRMGDDDIKWKTENNHMSEEDMELVDQMPQIKLANKFFHNEGAGNDIITSKGVTFSDWRDRIEDAAISFSNGSIYADLDNDGDLDIVTNNIDDEPFLYQNLTMEQAQGAQNFLAFQLKGSPMNVEAIGAKVMIRTDKGLFIEEQFPIRGYQSSVAPGIHIGLGELNEVQAATVIWPDGTYQDIKSQLTLNSPQVLDWEPGLPQFDYTSRYEKPKEAYDFEDITASSGLDFEHQENPFVEFNREGLIPHMMSAEGPALAVGDINGDGLEDVFLGNSKRRHSAIFQQRPNGTFVNRTSDAIKNDSLFEAVQAVFADLENDGDLDLLVATGGNEYRGESEALRQLAYVNDGKGNFTRVDLFPDVRLTASCILSADVNQDGLIDFFIGGRSITSQYGSIPNSYLFLNQGNGQFTDVTSQYSEDLGKAGLVKNGQWSDIDQDGDPDLILALEWAPITIYLNEGERLVKQTISEESGWWNFVSVQDFDQDGDLDILAGNLGENSKLRPTKDQPIRLYINDYDNNGQAEQLLTYYLDDEEVLFANYAELTKQMVGLKKKYLYAKDFAKASLSDLFGSEKLANASVFEVNTLSSKFYENTGASFLSKPLPPVLQFAPLKTAVVHELDADGKGEVILGGNFHESNIEMGFYDANYGNVLSFEDNGLLKVNPLGNLAVSGQVRQIAPIKIGQQQAFIFAKNDGMVQLIQYNGLQNGGRLTKR